MSQPSASLRLLPPAEEHRPEWERLYAGYANRLSGENETIAGDFASTPGTQGLILGSGLAAEDDWFEISAGAVARLRNGIDLSLAYETRTGGDRLRDVDVLMVGLRTRF